MSTLTLYASQSRTTTPTAVQFNRRRAKAMDVVIDCTTFAATPSVVVTVDGFDSLSNQWFNIGTSAAVTNTSTRVMQFGSALASTTNLSFNTFLPDKMRVVATHGDADAITYTISAILIK